MLPLVVMTTLSRSEQEQRKARRSRREWVDDNPGILTRIAQELGVTQPFVSDVLHGKRQSTGRIVEAALAAHGAPGFI